MPIDLSSIPNCVGLPDEAEMQQIDARVAEVSRAFAGTIAGYHDAISAAERRFESEAAGLIPQPQAGVEPTMSGGQRATLEDAARKAAARRVAEYRATLVQETSGNREEMLGQLRAAHARLDLALRATPSPVAMLGMAALGDERRQRYESQLYGAGPVTLGNAAIRAVATGDVALAAAVLARLDALPKDARPVQPQELAEKMVGPRHRDLVAKTERARIALDAATDADRMLRTGRGDSLGKVARGLAVRKLARQATKEGA